MCGRRARPERFHCSKSPITRSDSGGGTNAAATPAACSSLNRSKASQERSRVSHGHT